MSRPTISATDIPQADSLEKVRRVVSAVARQGAQVAGDLVQATGMSPRQVQYAIRAAITLRWLERSDQGLVPTTASDALLAIPEGRAAERALLRDLLSSNEILRAVVPDLLGDRPPSPVALGARIAAMTGLAPATAERRAGTLLRWRHEVLGEAVPAAAARRKRGSAPQMALPLFAVQAIELAEPLVRDIMRDNPWWRGEASRPLPPHPRRFTSLIHKRLRNRLAPVVVVRGPRQVGKTTAQLQVIENLLGSGIPRRQILRVQFDELPSLAGLKEPILRIVEWYETHVLGETLNSAATAGRPVYLFFDELQNLDGWAIQLKHLVDGSLVQVVVTGSSALRIEEGRDSLAGRITTIEVGTLSLAEISTIRGFGDLEVLLPDNGLEPLATKQLWLALRAHGAQRAALRDRALRAFSERGGYPIVHERWQVPWEEVASQLNENVIQRVIQHDLRVGETKGRKRDAALLEELFRLACRYAGQAPGPDLFAREVQRSLRANVGVQRVRHYLDFLDRTLLLRLVRPLEIRLKRSRGAHKLCLADHGLRASWLQEVVPIDPAGLERTPDLSDMAGRIVESIVGSYLMSLGSVALTHFPERKDEPEVDFVLTMGTQRIPIEVKYRRRIDERADTEGLRSFIERRAYNAPFGLLVTQGDHDGIADPRIVQIPLGSLLLLR